MDATYLRALLVKDTRAPRVLISEQFAYYGNSAIDIPDHIMLYDEKRRFKGIQSYHCNFPPTLKRYIVEWLQDLTRTPGIHDTPTNWNSANKASCVANPTMSSSATPRPCSN